METQIKVEIGSPVQGQYVATIFDQNDSPRMTIRLGDAVHLWHIDLVLGAYRLYWEAMGVRSEHLNVADGITFNPNVRAESQNVAKAEIAKALIDLVCRTNDPNQPNILRKLNENRYVYICSTNDRNADVYIAGGISSPYFFVRKRGTGEVIGRFDNVKSARNATSK